MTKKQVTAPAECLKMNIELADNGIIIRNPDEEDEVTLAMHRDDSDRARDDEYKAIGKKVFDWLMDVVIDRRLCYEADIVVTNFDIEVVATCKGRDFK